jgi:SAM-dependent methyltransferase
MIDVIEGREFPRSEEAECLLCDERRPSRKFSVRFGMQAMIAECAECRIAYQTPRPSPEASLAYMNWRWRSPGPYVADRTNQLERAARQVEYVKQQTTKPLRLLDFGAGAGSFVRTARDQGWDVDGIEQSISARERAMAFYGVELRTDFSEKPYDAATLWDVIEHLRDPISILRMIGEHLRPGGLIFIETGNFENWRRLADEDAWNLYLFDHQYYFTPSSLQAVLARSGFSDFRLLNTNRCRPSLNPKILLRHPSRSMRQWIQWRKAITQWPDHGDINVMIAVGFKQQQRIPI